MLYIYVILGGYSVRSLDRGRGRGVDFYIYPPDSIERKALLGALKTELVNIARALNRKKQLLARRGVEVNGTR